MFKVKTKGDLHINPKFLSFLLYLHTFSVEMKIRNVKYIMLFKLQNAITQ